MNAQQQRAQLDADPEYAAWLQARYAEFLAEVAASPAYRLTAVGEQVRRRFREIHARRDSEQERTA